MALMNASSVRAAAFCKAAFSFAKACSIGFRSGVRGAYRMTPIGAEPSTCHVRTLVIVEGKADR
jgi:hypothetical protein